MHELYSLHFCWVVLVSDFQLQCLGTWKEGSDFYLYGRFTDTEGNLDRYRCFVSKLYVYETQRQKERRQTYRQTDRQTPGDRDRDKDAGLHIYGYRERQKHRDRDREREERSVRSRSYRKNTR